MTELMTVEFLAHDLEIGTKKGKAGVLVRIGMLARLPKEKVAELYAAQLNGDAFNVTVKSAQSQMKV